MNQTQHKGITGDAFGKHNKRVKADVVFGMPTKNCINFGICEVTRTETKNENRKGCCKVKGTAIIVKQSDTQLRFFFEKKRMNKEIREKHFEQETFRVDENYELNEEILRELLLDEFTIYKGIYNVADFEAYLMIEFTNDK